MGGSAGPFFSTPDPLVASRLAMAEARTPSAVWEDATIRESGILYLAAHLLAIEPGAREMRKGERPGETAYWRERRILEGIVSSGHRVAKAP